MRPILLLLLSHAAGIVWADRGNAISAPILLLAAGATGLLALALGRRGALVVLAAASFCLGHQALSRAFERADADTRLVAELEPTGIHLVDARVAVRRATGFGEEVELVDVESRAVELGVPGRLLLAIAPGPSRAERLLWPGARVRVGVAIAPLRPTRNPGSPDREHALARQGIAARARLVKPDWVVALLPSRDPGARLSRRLAHLRSDLSGAVRERLARLGGREEGPPGAGLVRALALGDRRGLSDATRRSFRQLGLAHLISVSGLHIGFVAVPAAWAVARARALWQPRSRPVLGFVVPFAAGCVAAGTYAALTGAGVPALRASLLFALFGIGRALRISIRPATALGAIALALLLADPARLFDGGSLFSFTACAALVAGGVWGARPGPEERSLENRADRRASARVRRGLAATVDPLRASLAVSVGMLPLVELYGLPRAAVSPLVNAVAIPWAGLVVLPCALAASSLACLLPAGRGDEVLALLLVPAAWLEQASAWVAAQLPRALVGEDLPGRLAWPWALSIGGFAFARLRRGDIGSAAAVWVVLAVLGIEPLCGPFFAGELPRVVFFDVGQADAALVQSRDSAWLIDSGPGSEDGSGGTTVLRGLRAQGVDRLDVLAISHGDLDHRGGALRILSAVNVGELWLPARAAADPGLAALAGAARSRGVHVRWAGAGDRIGSSQSISAEVLWPPAPIPANGDGPGRDRSVGQAAEPAPTTIRAGPARNDASLVLRVEVGGRRFLFTGDISEDVEERLLDLDTSLRAEVLKVAHHGSRGGSSEGFLAAVSPEIAVVSAPCGAGRGLPSAPALARLHASGAELGWTGRDGAIAVAGGGEGAAALRMRYWGGERRCVPDIPRSPAEEQDKP